MLAQYLDSLGAVNLRKSKKESRLSILLRITRKVSCPFVSGKRLHRIPEVHFGTRLQAQPCS